MEGRSICITHCLWCLEQSNTLLGYWCFACWWPRYCHSAIQKCLAWSSGMMSSPSSKWVSSCPYQGRFSAWPMSFGGSRACHSATCRKLVCWLCFGTVVYFGLHSHAKNWYLQCTESGPGFIVGNFWSFCSQFSFLLIPKQNVFACVVVATIPLTFGVVMFLTKWDAIVSGWGLVLLCCCYLVFLCHRMLLWLQCSLLAVFLFSK